MCGFVGYFKPKELNFNLDLKQSSNSIIHRGPDMQNNVISETYNIFFNRLSINDLSDNGQQPFTFDDNTVFANGEIYNHKKIRDDHKDEISFETRCDMEVVPFLYKKYGKNFLHKINGYFSMILIDSKNDKYYVISDRYGVKPAYYTVNNDVLYFSSELKGLEKMLKLDYDYNNIALAVSTVDFCYPLSSYKNVYRLPPGHILEYNEGKIKLSTSKDLYLVEYTSKSALGVLRKRPCIELFTQGILGTFFDPGFLP